MTRVLEIPFPPSHNPVGSRPGLPFVPVEPRWEYKAIALEAGALLSETELNALGEQRWELVGVAPGGNHVHFYFKREQHA
jgi:hypothetical protein